MRAGRASILVCGLLVACSSTSEPGATPDGGLDGASADDAGVYSPTPEPGRHFVEIVETRQVIPGPGLPPEAKPQTSNNNLDVARHDGRVYLAWRTGPDHYASDETALYVVSSADEKTWTFETKVTSGEDLREPRFLSWNGSLFLYLARLGKDPNKFEPKGMSYVERAADGTWGALTDFGDPTFIPWRARVERGTPYLVAYDHGEQLYFPKDIPLDPPLSVHLLTTTDGKSWTGVDPANPVVSVGGGSETDFTIGDDGTLYAVTRVEGADPFGMGSKVCRASAGAITKWTCKHDRRKFDSPLMFWHDGEAYLIGRRNLSPTGEYDRAEIADLPLADRWFQNQLDYRNHPKRCALWRYVQGDDRIAFVTDLPSKGDTCFPARIAGERPDELVVYDYSSPVDSADDPPWIEGQLGPTNVYRHVLRFTKR